jgi:hypothetical protein
MISKFFLRRRKTVKRLSNIIFTVKYANFHEVYSCDIKVKMFIEEIIEALGKNAAEAIQVS